LWKASDPVGAAGLNKTAKKFLVPTFTELSKIVGQSVKTQRQIAGMSLRELAKLSNISAAMVSRIENGQVSPSLATLEALAEALAISVITFFADSVQTADVNFVKAGNGLPAQRNFADHSHDFRILGSHGKSPLEFEAVSVNIDRRPENNHPRYMNRGFVFITVTEGDCIYGCGQQDYSMSKGDSISFDAELLHGIKRVVSKSVSYISVSAKIS
tara:strand:- start:605 stop:1246 length:642 start_codon:yes stop_codon:yes gene_type:complete